MWERRENGRKKGERREMRWGGAVNDEDSVRRGRESRASQLESGDEEEMI